MFDDRAFELSPAATRLNEQLHYGYDAAGNLMHRTNNALVQSFAVNSNNELTANTNGGTLTVVGTTTSTATNVTVNGYSASRYGDATFASTNLPLTTTYTAIASDSYGRTASNTVTVSLSTNVTFQYDANGNLTNDGLRSFAYDDENQLIQVWVTTNWLSQFSYDGLLRRRIRQEFTWNGSAWIQTNAVYYVYDGNLVIQERDVNNLPATTYTRGKDLSGSLDGAGGIGGIGGLLARTAQVYVDAPMAGHTFYHADGNGNITMLINSSQAIVAKYLYDAFGNMLAKSGLLADANVYQFSSKEKHLNSETTYYLYRYYDPNLQRWLNRDPIQEAGGINLYTFNRNNPISFIDPFGLTTYVWPPEYTPPGTYGPTATVVNDGSTAVLPAIPYLTDSQGLQSSMSDFAFFLPEIPAVSKALGAAADAIGNAAKDALDALGLAKPKLPTPPIKCPTKAAAKNALNGMGLPQQQLQKALSAVSRATSQSAIDISQQGDNVIVSVTRPGADGYQAITSTVAPDGTKTVVQTAYDSSGNLVHYDPKN